MEFYYIRNRFELASTIVFRLEWFVFKVNNFKTPFYHNRKICLKSNFYLRLQYSSPLFFTSLYTSPHLAPAHLHLATLWNVALITPGNTTARTRRGGVWVTIIEVRTHNCCCTALFLKKARTTQNLPAPEVEGLERKEIQFWKWQG